MCAQLFFARRCVLNYCLQDVMCSTIVHKTLCAQLLLARRCVLNYCLQVVVCSTIVCKTLCAQLKIRRIVSEKPKSWTKILSN